MFTLEIGGKPIAVIDSTEEDARELFESEEFKEDLLGLESDGKPLWDGKAKLLVRAANAEEKAEFDEADLEDEDDLEEGEPIIMFLVTVDNLEDDEED